MCDVLVCVCVCVWAPAWFDETNSGHKLQSERCSKHNEKRINRANATLVETVTLLKRVRYRAELETGGTV